MNSLQEINQRLMTLPKVAWDAFKYYAEKKEEFTKMDNQKKSMLAAYELKYSDCKSQAEIQRNALADEDYKEFVDKLSVVEAEFIKAQSRVEAVKAEISILQTISKNLVAESQITNA